MSITVEQSAAPILRAGDPAGASTWSPPPGCSLLGQPAEETEDLVPAVVGAAERPDAQCVPGHIVGDQLSQRRQVSLGKGFIASACQLDVRVLGHRCLRCRSAWIIRISPRLCTITPAAPALA